jgi:hypothetical protein
MSLHKLRTVWAVSAVVFVALVMAAALVMVWLCLPCDPYHGGVWHALAHC